MLSVSRLSCEEALLNMQGVVEPASALLVCRGCSSEGVLESEVQRPKEGVVTVCSSLVSEALQFSMIVSSLLCSLVSRTLGKVL